MWRAAGAGPPDRTVRQDADHLKARSTRSCHAPAKICRKPHPTGARPQSALAGQRNNAIGGVVSNANIEETLTYFRLPLVPRKDTKSTNMLERLNEQIRGHLRGAIVPNAEAA